MILLVQSAGKIIAIIQEGCFGICQLNKLLIGLKETLQSSINKIDPQNIKTEPTSSTLKKKEKEDDC